MPIKKNGEYKDPRNIQEMMDDFKETVEIFKEFLQNPKIGSVVIMLGYAIVFIACFLDFLRREEIFKEGDGKNESNA